MNKIVELINTFALLSLLAVGGGTAVLPEMKHDAVQVHHWVTDTQFAQIYSLGQLAPGPNMTCVWISMSSCHQSTFRQEWVLGPILRLCSKGGVLVHMHPPHGQHSLCRWILLAHIRW